MTRLEMTTMTNFFRFIGPSMFPARMEMRVGRRGTATHTTTEVVAWYDMRIQRRGSSTRVSWNNFTGARVRMGTGAT